MTGSSKSTLLATSTPEQEFTMVRFSLVLAFCGTVAAWATPQERAAEVQECEDEITESTGSRVETRTVCRPAEAD